MWVDNDYVIFQIMRFLENLEDVFSMALLNSKAYHVFKKHELILIKSMIFKMSPPAWELQEITFSEMNTELTATSYLQNYQRSLFVIIELKVFILCQCANFLPRKTLFALTGQDEESENIDRALWRIWVFCQIFGCGKNREGDINGQILWLNGGQSPAVPALVENVGGVDGLTMPPHEFATGNCGGLTKSDLSNMATIWLCLRRMLEDSYDQQLKTEDKFQNDEYAGLFSCCVDVIYLQTDVVSRKLDIISVNIWSTNNSGYYLIRQCTVIREVDNSHK
ncbi:hypothetical protein EMCG_01644 [[Emmonsia] crescens]|uniref:Uncharacterized protein n=1 Tax=[Emmonsia] crescens TaxID=73230 RepID=A0A0G2I1N8_9EURO|nr:hypothetical protein EMCG_01644 [Emmonsia crescens UAMH 3008]